METPFNIKKVFKNQWQKEKAAWNHIKSSPTKPFKNNSGISMMVALSALLMILWIANEITYDSTVEYTVNSQNLNKIKAYYAAKSGLDIALLRIKIYQKVSSQFGDQLGNNAAMLDEIWRFPFAWPLPVSENTNAVEKDNIKDAVKESFMDASFMTTIEDEGSKIDLGDLVSKSEVVRKNARKQILSIFESEKKQNRDFEEKYSNLNFEELVNQITDYMSSTTQSAGGQGNKAAAFAELNSEAKSQMFPPNRAFRSLAELRFIPLMTDDLFDYLEPRITIYGMKGINPNLANKEVLKSLDPGITSEVADEIIKRRTDQNAGGPFQNAEDFWSFAQTKGARLEGEIKDIPLVFDRVLNFKIRSSGSFANSVREIAVVVMDLDQVALKIVEQNKTEEQKKADAANKNKGSTTPQTTTVKGPPRIVWWSEK